MYADDLAINTQSKDFASIEETLTSALERERERERIFIKINRKHDDTCTNKNYNVD